MAAVMSCCEPMDVPEASPLRENAVMLQNLDTLLPIFQTFAEELADFRRSLGNGAFAMAFKFPEEP